MQKRTKKAVLNPGYFGPIDWFLAFINAEEIVWEYQDNYQKQTYRNRQYIYGANGLLSLNIPIIHAGNKNNRQKYREVRIENHTSWQKIHWRSLESAYRTSPFFEFYEKELAALYEKPFTYLMDFNYHCLQTLCSCLQVHKNAKQTSCFYKSFAHSAEVTDYRHLVKAKRPQSIKFESYDQVFQEKHGFIANLSILDLLFNKGPQTIAYLEENSAL